MWGGIQFRKAGRHCHNILLGVNFSRDIIGRSSKFLGHVWQLSLKARFSITRWIPLLQGKGQMQKSIEGWKK